MKLQVEDNVKLLHLEKERAMAKEKRRMEHVHRVNELKAAQQKQREAERKHEIARSWQRSKLKLRLRKEFKAAKKAEELAKKREEEIAKELQIRMEKANVVASQLEYERQRVMLKNKRQFQLGRVLAKKNNNTALTKLMKKAYKLADADNSGGLSKKEFIEAGLGSAELFQTLDRDKDGEVSFQEYKRHGDWL
eukprot:g3960.t1